MIENKICKARRFIHATVLNLENNKLDYDTVIAKDEILVILKLTHTVGGDVRYGDIIASVYTPKCGICHFFAINIDDDVVYE